MGKKGKGAARPMVTPPETRTIFNRGEQYQAEMLTGNRAQKGNLPGGAPRFKKLTFEGDTMIKPAARRDAIKWMSEEYNAKYKGKAAPLSHPPLVPPLADGDVTQDASPADAASHGHLKRRKVSAASFFAPRVAGAAKAAATPTAQPPADGEDVPYADELTAYLSLSQAECSDDPLEWWAGKAKKFPNLSVMARQYLGCPASSATVERLFSQVGIAFSDLRKNSKAELLSDILFTKLNVN